MSWTVLLLAALVWLLAGPLIAVVTIQLARVLSRRRLRRAVPGQRRELLTP